MNLLIDSINPEGTIGLVARADKIYHNFCLMGVLEQYITELQKRKETTFSFMTLFGRWIIIYQGGDINIDDAEMHFIDFRIDLKRENNEAIFSEEIKDTFADIQTSYANEFTADADFVELTHAEPYEKVLKPNFFVCEDEEKVLEKSKSLNVLPMVKSLSDNVNGKFLIMDEVITIDDITIINIYAIITFGGNENKKENGSIYLKIYDLFNNFDKVNDLKIGIEQAGGEFDISFFIEHLNKGPLKEHFKQVLFN